MLFIGTQENFTLNRDGKKYIAEKTQDGLVVLEAPEKYKKILKVYGFEPEKNENNTNTGEK